MNEYYHWYKEHGICVICQQEDAQPGYTMCLSCRMEHRFKGDTHSDEAKARHRKYLKRRRDLLYAFGVCVVCGVKDAKKGSHVCPYCLAKSRQRSENYRRQKGIIPRNSYTKSGICYLCDKPAIDGKKTCEEHYAILKERMLHAKACQTEKNYFEKANELFWQK